MQTVLTIGAFFALPYIFYAVIQTARRHSEINTFGTLLACAALIIPLSIQAIEIVTDTTKPLTIAAVLACAGIVVLFSLVISVLDLRRPDHALNHSYGPLGIGLGLLLVAGTIITPTVVSLFPNAIATAQGTASNQSINTSLASNGTPGASSLATVLSAQTGLEGDALLAQVNQGKSIADLVSAHSGDLKAVTDAFTAALTEMSAQRPQLLQRFGGDAATVAGQIVSGQASAQLTQFLLPALISGTSQSQGAGGFNRSASSGTPGAGGFNQPIQNGTPQPGGFNQGGQNGTPSQGGGFNQPIPTNTPGQGGFNQGGQNGTPSQGGGFNQGGFNQPVQSGTPGQGGFNPGGFNQGGQNGTPQSGGFNQGGQGGQGGFNPAAQNPTPLPSATLAPTSTPLPTRTPEPTATLIPTSTPLGAETETVNAPTCSLTVLYNLNMRAAPNKDGGLILTIPADSVVASTGNNGDGWWQVTYQDRTGWVDGSYVTPSSACDGLPTLH